MPPPNPPTPTPSTAPAAEPLPRAFPGGLLRRLRAVDLAAFQAYRAWPGLGRYQGWTPMADADAERFIAEMAALPLFVRGQWLQLAIAAPDGVALLGDLGLHVDADGGAAEIGFTLAPQAQGRGLGAAAVRAAVGLLFEAGVGQVRALSDARNTPSLRLLARAGFRQVDSVETLFRGEPCTEHVFVIVR